MKFSIVVMIAGSLGALVLFLLGLDDLGLGIISGTVILACLPGILVGLSSERRR